jgi:hypothetical protein
METKNYNDKNIFIIWEDPRLRNGHKNEVNNTNNENHNRKKTDQNDHKEPYANKLEV